MSMIRLVFGLFILWFYACLGCVTLWAAAWIATR